MERKPRDARVNKLTDQKIKKAKFIYKNYKLNDGKGLYLFVTKTGKFWRYDYAKPKNDTLVLGEYPNISLEQARILHKAARDLVLAGINPKEHKREQAKQQAQQAITFRDVALQWHEMKSPMWRSAKTVERSLRRLELHVFPWIGNRPIASLEPTDILELLEALAAQSKLEEMRRVRGTIGMIFRYAVTKRYAKRDESADLKGALPTRKEKHFSAIIDPVEFGRLIAGIDDYQGALVTKIALKLSAYLFGRPTEMRSMEWSEINIERALWVLPDHKMKNGKPHIVPLPRQVLVLLEQIRPVTGRYRYVFPSMTDKAKPMSDNTIRQALRRMGYTKEEATAHGFRTSASTLLYEMGYDADLVERSLAHTVGSEVRQAYDRSTRLKDRTAMMQRWADYLDELATSN